MTTAFKPAVRENVHLLIGVAGGTGSGKTMSALRLARGLAGADPFALIDTESRRALHYGDHFQPWHHGELEPPFRPQAYLDAITAAAKDGYGVIVVDSASHEHAGTGGLLDWHEEELHRMAGDDFGRRQAMTFAAWIKPKMAHKAFVQELLQLKAHLILCFRAEEKIEIVKRDGKWVVEPKKSLKGLDGWIPVSEKNLPYELTLSLLMTADAPGIPKPIKLPEDLKPFVRLDQPISEETGVRLAEWARGGASPEAAASTPPAGAAEEGAQAGKAAEAAAASGDEERRFQPPPSEDPIVIAANEAAEVLIPSGVNQGRPIRDLLDAKEGMNWLRVALRRRNPDEEFTKACWAFARVYAPDLYEQISDEKAAAVA